MKYMFFSASALDQLLSFNTSSVTDSTCITDGSEVRIHIGMTYYYEGDSFDEC